MLTLCGPKHCFCDRHGCMKKRSRRRICCTMAAPLSILPSRSRTLILRQCLAADLDD